MTCYLRRVIETNDRISPTGHQDVGTPIHGQRVHTLQEKEEEKYSQQQHGSVSAKWERKKQIKEKSKERKKQQQNQKNKLKKEQKPTSSYLGRCVSAAERS